MSEPVAEVKHINILTRDLQRSFEFYTSFMGFKYVKNLGPKKIVLDAAGFDFFLEEVDDVRLNPQFHFGLKIDYEGIMAFAKRLEAAGIPLVQGNNPAPIVYTMPGTDRTALYFQDPDGWTIEVYTAA